MTPSNDPQGALLDRAERHQLDFEELRRATAEAVDWLEAHGVRVDSTRIQHLVTRLQGAGSSVGALRPTPGETVASLWTFAELHDLLTIHAQLKATSAPRFIESLKQISKGPRLLEQEGIEGGSIHGRNTTFELFCAARLVSLGVDVSFDTLADATLHINGERLALECKRLANVEQLERNVEDAARQIRRRIADGEAAAGIAAISISRGVHGLLIEQGSQPVGNPEVMRAELRQMVANWGPEFHKRFSRLSPGLVGVLLHYKFPIIDSRTGGAVLLSRFAMYALDSAESPGEVVRRSRACLHLFTGLTG